MASVPQTKPPPGFMAWVNPYGLRSGRFRPSDYEVVEVWSAYDGERYTVEPAKMHPAQNVACLYWRPVKGFDETAN